MLKQQIKELLLKVRAESPLIHQITNYVTVNDCANITLAVGASPVMADDIAEVADITSISKALAINIGTLNARTIEAMLLAGQTANKVGVPVVIDPVGVGASKLRNDTIKTLLKAVRPAVLRGNASEISFIAGIDSNTKGVDVSENDKKNTLEKNIEIAKSCAIKHSCVVAMTGIIDIITDGGKPICIENGHASMSKITGTGCMCSALVASFCGATTDYLLAATAGVMSMGIAGELAASAKGTGSQRTGIIDA